MSVQNRPTQAMAYHYQAGLDRYAMPGGLLITIERNQDRSSVAKKISEAGGHVWVYIDPIIDNPYGEVSGWLHKANDLGPATALWPGRFRANQWGMLTDFRPGSALQRKWPLVLRKIAQQIPHIGGFFLDDVGSRSWYPGFDWGRFPDKSAYRQGAIELVRAARLVADEHGLVVAVNGTWGAGDLVRNGGGYPDPGKHGNALADGGMVEHHDSAGELPYWREYCTMGQWAKESPVTQGVPIMLSCHRSRESLDRFVRAGVTAYAEYSGQNGPWTPPHATGLPSKVARKK